MCVLDLGDQDVTTGACVGKVDFRALKTRELHVDRCLGEVEGGFFLVDLRFQRTLIEFRQRLADVNLVIEIDEQLRHLAGHL